MGHKWNKYLASAPDKLDPILSLDRCLIVLSDAQDLASPRKTISGKEVYPTSMAETVIQKEYGEPGTWKTRISKSKGCVQQDAAR